jgi:flagellar M-ring protein FliF
MVALAIAGLAPENVAVIDSRQGIIAGPNVDKMANPSLVAADISERLEAKVQRLLEARLGAGNSEVSVTVDVTRARERTSAVRFDPESRVVRQKTTNDSNQTGTTEGGALTVASNLPQAADANAGGGTNTARNSTESISYEVNETRTEVERLPGEIKRLSIAVMLNEQALIAGVEGGAQPTPLAEFESLISSAVGLDDTRGDTISVEIMPFKVTAEEVLPAAPSFLQAMLDQYMWSGLQALLLSLVILVLGLGVIRPIMKPKQADDASDTDEEALATGAQSGETVEGDPFAYLKDYAREREAETTALLKEWLAEDNKVSVNG